MAIFVPNPSHPLLLLQCQPHAQGQPSSHPSIKSPSSSSRTITRLTSPTLTPIVTEEDDSSPPPPPATSTAGCQTCGREEIEKGCNGEGRTQGGIATVPGFGWWPIKAYRPCPGFTASGGRYRRRGQSMDDVASGRGRGREFPLKSTDDEAKSSKKKMKQQSS